MKRASIILSLLLPFLPSAVVADGYPFHNDTHEVIGDSLQLSLSETQVAEVSSTGLLTFTERQRALLTKFYANAPKKIRVISSTFNDGLDEREPNPVDCIWTSPEHVGITMREKYQDGEYTFDTEADSWPLIRIAPDGTLYSRGTNISKEAAGDLIRGAKGVEGGTEPPQVRITLPPPFRQPEHAEANASVLKLFDDLVEIGKKSGVTVHRCW